MTRFEAPHLVRRLAAAAALTVSGVGNLAAAPVTLTDAQLVDRFWDCDALSTRVALSGADGAQCVQWMDELKQRRFGGDFERFLAWWRTHRVAEHARRLRPVEAGHAGPVTAE